MLFAKFSKNYAISKFSKQTCKRQGRSIQWCSWPQIISTHVCNKDFPILKGLKAVSSLIRIPTNTVLTLENEIRPFFFFSFFEQKKKKRRKENEIRLISGLTLHDITCLEHLNIKQITRSSIKFLGTVIIKNLSWDCKI